RPGNRGGQGDFKWSDVSGDKDRENYLGHSINAPTGRWQKNKDVHWYSRDQDGTQEERDAEIRKIKEAEADALAVALGFAPADRTGEAPTSSPPDEQDQSKEEKRRRKAERKEEKRAKKEQRRLERDTRRDVSDRRERTNRRSASPPPPRRRSLSRERDYGAAEREREREKDRRRWDTNARRQQPDRASR
ncbi:kinase phosphorylation protein-domain-containing protein, partial [Mycena amicta]